VKGSILKRCPCGGAVGKACKKRHGTWSYVADIGRDPKTGKRRQEKRGGFRTAEDASAALAKLISDLSTGQHAHDDRQTVGVFLTTWIENKVDGGLRPTTERSYRAHIRDHLTPHMGHLRLRDLRPGHVAAMLRAAGKAPSTGAASVRRIHATLRSALTSAVRQQLVAFNAAANVELPAAPRPKVRPWEPAELGAFLDSIGADRLAGLFELVAMTGLRRGEACGLRWDDVDLVAARLVVRQQVVQVGGHHACPYCAPGHRGLMFGPPKTSSGEARVVELDAGTVGVLLAHKLSQDAEREQWGEAYIEHGLVFAREDGNPLRLELVTERFGQLAGAAGLRVIRLHDLRHGAASLRLASGTDIAVVSKMLGHSSISITSDTYSHLLEGVGRAASERAAALIPRDRKNARDQSVTRDEESAVPNPESADVFPGEEGAPSGTRTPNPLIKSRRDSVPGSDAR